MPAPWSDRILLLILAVLVPLGLTAERSGMRRAVVASVSLSIIDEPCSESPTEIDPDEEPSHQPAPGPTIHGAPGVLGERGHSGPGVVRVVYQEVIHVVSLLVEHASLANAPEGQGFCRREIPWAMGLVARADQPHAPPTHPLRV